MSAQQTHVFLDVDGVFNAFGFTGVSRDGHWPSRAGTHHVNGYTFTVFPEVVEWINETAARDDVQFHWLTTWRQDAAAEVSPIVGINGQAWPVLDKEERPTSWKTRDETPWWKLSAIREHVEDQCPDCRFVWIDDDLFDTRAREWASDYEADGRAILIQPSPHLGLSPAHLTMVNAFLDITREAQA